MGACVLLGAAACGDALEGGSQDVAVAAFVVESVCTDQPDTIPDDALRCSDTVTYECGREPETLQFYVEESNLASSCSTSTLTVTPEGPYQVGDIRLALLEQTMSGTSEVCTATVTLQDTQTPTVTPHAFELWPPNHKMVDILPEDCADVIDDCSGDAVSFRFTYVTSDEPANSTGDGNFEPDMEIGCGVVRVRSERRGPSDGRVYRIGFEVEDAGGNRVTGECTAEVPKSQAQPAVDSGERVRLEADDAVCEDEGEEPEDDADTSVPDGEAEPVEPEEPTDPLDDAGNL